MLWKKVGELPNQRNKSKNVHMCVFFKTFLYWLFNLFAFTQHMTAYVPLDPTKISKKCLKSLWDPQCEEPGIIKAVQTAFPRQELLYIFLSKRFNSSTPMNWFTNYNYFICIEYKGLIKLKRGVPVFPKTHN